MISSVYSVLIQVERKRLLGNPLIFEQQLMVRWDEEAECSVEDLHRMIEDAWPQNDYADGNTFEIISYDFAFCIESRSLPGGGILTYPPIDTPVIFGASKPQNNMWVNDEY